MASNQKDQGTNLNQFEKDFLESHNKYRKLHGSPPLTINRDMCKSAQEWAEHLVSIQKYDHSGVKGENIYGMSFSSPSDLKGNEPVDLWYSEFKDYDFSKPGFSNSTGHFTQVVWKDSKELGYGVATADKKKYYVVGRYMPKGNFNGPDNYAKNVLPLQQ